MILIDQFSIRVFIFSMLVFSAILSPAPSLGADNDKAEEFGIKERPVQKETVLDVIFGSAPPMPTERGILVIDAFEDLNNNGEQDTSEPELRNEIICKIDEIDYVIPAFIPGLDYNNRYEVRCSGENYFPTMPDREILIEHRGHVIEIALPCSKNMQKKDSNPNPGK